MQRLAEIVGDFYSKMRVYAYFSQGIIFFDKYMLVKE